MPDPLVNLLNIRLIWLRGNPIKDREPLFTLLRNNPYVRIYLKYGEGQLQLPVSFPPWDVNQDGNVNILDLILVAQFFNTDASQNPQADVNGDGLINILDLIVIAQNFSESTATAPDSVSIDTLQLTSTMVKGWIKQAQAEDDGSVAVREGIAKLQELLEVMTVPEKTKLLGNYPNPFNPETWIPYQLAESESVTLTIYAANGSKVRTLVLGQQSAGIYQSRGRAAYWDGKNDEGESVSSGIYFYTFTAGDFAANRKMLLVK